MVSPRSLARIIKERYLGEKWDWREHGLFNDDPPSQRETTGWAYASVAAVEANLQIEQGISEKLSVQNLIDCCYLKGEIKRKTSTTSVQTLAYIKDKGITTATEYPTLLPPAAAQATCKCCVNEMPPKVKIRKLTILGVPDITERSLIDAIKKTPVIVSIWAGKKFDDYKKEDNISKGEGFYAHDTEKEDVYRHCLLLVGYDTEKGGDGEPGIGYWILRNSHGTAWGNKGYMKLRRDQTSKFTLATYPEQAYLVAAPAP